MAQTGKTADIAWPSVGDGMSTASWTSSTTQTPTIHIPKDSPVGAEDTATGPGIFDSFKDSQGRYRTQSLFIETPHESYPAFFTTKKQDVEKNGKTYLSLYQKYMAIADPTEYQVAIQLFGSWDHWVALCRSKWFTDLLTGWREELKTKMESARYFEMLNDVGKGTPQAIQATKWLAERYGDTKTIKRGRPSKAERALHLRQLTENSEAISEDAERIGLK